MDFQASLEQLENACRAILAPPNLVTKDERTAAESIILTFRKTRNAFAMCKFILENSQTELVVFETSDVLRNNLIHDWAKIAPVDIDNISRHILNLLISNTAFSYSVLRRLAGVIALIVKHQSLMNSGTQRNDLVNMIVGGAVEASGHQLTVACCMLDGLLAEHQYVVNSDDASLTYEQHFTAKRDFEGSDLLKVFQFCLRFLTNYLHSNHQQRHHDLDHVLRVLESILSWNFTKTNLPKRVAGVIEMETTPSFKPPNSWLETINDEGFVPIFFNTHVKLRQDENFVLRSINLLAQLVSMHRPVPINLNNRVEFLSKILPPFTTLLNLPNKIKMEIYGLSDLIRKILLFNRAALLSIVQPGIMDAFFKAVGAFSCLVIQESAIEESTSNVDDKLYRESLTRVLEAWMDILTENEHVPKEMVQPIVTDIFNSYLKAHLSPPEGFRRPVPEEEDGIEDDEEEGDTNQFRDQLQAVGIFARFILPHSVPILTNLLTFKCQALQKQIELVASQAAPRETLEMIYEDLHWGILMAGHLIAYDGMGETNLIPSEINEYSMSTQANPDLSAKAFTDSFQMISVGNADNVDPIVKLVCSIIMLSETERRVSASGLGQLLSPELASNVLWFLNRFCESYFIMSEEYYASVSPCLLTAWGPGSDSATLAQSALLTRVKEDLMRYSGEVIVMKDAINLLLSLVDSNKKADLAIRSSELPPIIQIANGVGPGKYQMPNETYRKLIRAVISIGSFCDDPSKRDQYWDQILTPLTTRFRNLCGLTGRDKHRDDVRQEMACVLSGFIGSAMSAHSRTASTLYKRIGPVVLECGAILDTYHNYIDIVELCLELVIELAKRSLSYLNSSDSLTLYQSAMSVVKSYALHASGRVSSESTAEEDTYNDLVILMDMLTCLLSKDFLDLSPESLSGSHSTPPVSACDVSLHGLSIVLPLMNAELLQFPNLSNKYFRLVAFLSELHSDKMMNLPNAMLQGVCESVQIGLQNCAADSFSCCCEFLSCMANYISRQPPNSVPSAEYCKPFLKVFLEMILSQKISKESLPAVSSVLFHLISAFSDSYTELVHQLLNTRTDEESRNNLSQAFNKLTENLNMQHGGDRMSRAGFRDRLEHFIFEAKGCLQ